MSCKVLTVVGPTAVGKSSLAVELAKAFDGEIINADSIQVYKGLNIGSAKVTEAEKQGIPHHLLDYKELTEPYSVSQFQTDARKAIKEITARGHLPIICGGTGLYVKALLYDYAFVPMDRQDNDYPEYETAELYEMLREKDARAAESIHPNNRKRIIRALDMALSGNLKSEQEDRQQHAQLYDSFILGLTMDRDRLKERISQRIDLMMNQGLLDEVRYINENYDWSLQSLQGIGYKEFRAYLLGNQSLEETAELIQLHTRQFAKRQYTWWNHQLPVRWYDVNEASFVQIKKDVEEWLHG